MTARAADGTGIQAAPLPLPFKGNGAFLMYG